MKNAAGRGSSVGSCGRSEGTWERNNDRKVLVDDTRGIVDVHDGGDGNEDIDAGSVYVEMNVPRIGSRVRNGMRWVCMFAK